MTDDWPISVAREEYHPIPASWIEFGHDAGDGDGTRIYAVSVVAIPGTRGLLAIRYLHPRSEQTLRVTTKGSPNPTGDGLIPASLRQYHDWPRSRLAYADPTGSAREPEIEHLQELWHERVAEIPAPEEAVEDQRELMTDGGRDEIAVDGSEHCRVLNLYAGIGGNRRLWDDVDVTAVEINEDVAAEYQRQYPDDEVIVADAHEFLRDHYDDGWDFIWSSPPCQSHSKMTYTTWFMERCSGPSYPDMNLYEEILFLEQFYDGDWVVENVQPWYDELISGTKIGRHIFWSNYHIPPAEGPERDFEFTSPTEANKERLEDWLGITVSNTIYLENNDPSQVLRNAVHPDLGQHVFGSKGSHQQQTLVQADGGRKPRDQHTESDR